MKVAHFFWEYVPEIVGGLGVYAEGIAGELIRFGVDVDVYTLNNGSLKTEESLAKVKVFRPLLKRPEDFFNPLLSENWNSWRGGSELAGWVLMHNILAAKKFVDDVTKGKKCDVVVCHDWLAGLAAILIKANTNIPVIFQLHSTEWGRSNSCPFGPIAEIEKKAAEVSDAIITVSNPMQEHLANLGLDSKKIRVVWNGVDVDVFNPKKVSEHSIELLKESYGIRPGELMVLYMGRLAAEKGALELVQAMPLLKEGKTKLVIVGVGNQESALKSTVQGLNISDRVLLNFNFLSLKERILHYAACDIAVFPSHFEPFGLVAAEAMAMEKPVVVGASGINGFKDQVIISGDYKTGCHVDGRNPADIAAWGIDPLCAMEPNERKIIGRNGRQRVIQYFTLSRSAEQALRVYEEVSSNAIKLNT